MNVRSVETSSINYLRKSLRAYLEGEPNCTLPWVVGIVKASSNLVQARTLLEAQFAPFSSTSRYRDLMTQFRTHREENE